VAGQAGADRSLLIAVNRLIPRDPTVIAPGAVHLPGWLGPGVRAELVARCRAWGDESGGPRTPRMPNGAPMSVTMVGLGWHWYPYRYSRTRNDGDGGRSIAFPGWLGGLSRRAVVDAVDVDPSVAPDAGGFAPDVALVNWYAPGAKMGMHVDDDEACPAPVVSLSVGATAVFRFGNPAGRGRPWTDVLLESGDAVVFGGPSRLAFHGVPRLVRGTDDPAVGVLPGRLNVTVRQTGLSG
jgi:DNA oxidative demethylase